MLTVTFRDLHEAGACTERYAHFRRAMREHGVTGDTVRIPLVTALETNGVADTLWALRAVPPEQRESACRLATIYACDCAEHVLPIYERQYSDDSRVRDCIATTRRYLAGSATESDLRAARAAALAALAAAAAADAALAAALAAHALAAAAAADAALPDADAARAAALAALAAAAAADAALAAAAAERQWQTDHLRSLLEAQVPQMFVPDALGSGRVCD